MSRPQRQRERERKETVERESVKQNKYSRWGVVAANGKKSPFAACLLICFLFLLASCVSLATCLLSQLDLVLHSLSKSEISTNSQQREGTETRKEREREMRKENY